MASDNYIAKKILNELRKKPMSVARLSAELKMRREFLGGYLEALRSVGKLEMIQVGKAKVYKPKN
ncbi:MAG: hypothetical protein HY516_01940 [Candidatus Aenigmarchaeota archaeon]|nr:hypothetical protein [Candidatus Aenigmarchaeota archaeon]